MKKSGFNRKNSVNWVIAVAATFIGTVVGAGFASGQEIYQFFSCYGFYGFFGLLLAVLVLGWFGGKIFRIGCQIQPHSYYDFLIYIFGTTIAKFIDLLLFIFLLLLTGVMFAGSGALFETLGFGYWNGLICTGSLLMFVLLFDLAGLITANLMIVPLMLVGSVFISIHAIADKYAPVIFHSFHISWVLASLQFAAYNLILATPVLLSLAKKFPSLNELKCGGWVGSIGLGIMAWLIHWALLTHLPNIKQSALPMVELAKISGFYPYWGYAVVLWGEMFSTLLANTYGITQRLSNITGWSFRVSMIIITMAGVLISQIGFTNLIAAGYPLFGFLALIMMFFLLSK